MRATRTLLVIALVAGMAADASSTSARQPRRFDVRVFPFEDGTRTIVMPGGRRVARPVTTVVRYPTAGGPYPLVVFGHGFGLTPVTYSQLLEAWTRAGYVVAAPFFALGNANAPGGPTEADLPNQPADMSLVITRLLALNARPGSVLEGRIDPSRIGIAGHSDGGVTALAAAYDSRFRDRRIGAAVILSGSEMTGMAAFPESGPPLLAMQGTADPINDARYTEAYYRRARRPKFLVLLLGASHRMPYTSEEPQLRIVEDITVAFLDHFLKRAPLRRFLTSARNARLSTLSADP